MHPIRIIFLILASSNFVLGQSQEGLKAINGTRIYVKTLGEGESIVVIHGGPGMNHSYLSPHLDELSDDHQVVYYDQRASGKSAVPNTDSISIAMFVADIEELRKNLNKERIFLLAHSWGVLPAVNYAIRFPQNVSGLILCNAIPLSKEYDEEMKKTQLTKVSGLDSTDRSIIVGSPNFKAGKASAYKKLLLLSFRNSFHKHSNHRKLNFDLPNNYKQASTALYTGLGKELGQYDYYEAVKQFPFPILILHGEADVVPMAANQRIVDNAPNATIEVFKKSGHFIFIEENRKFNAMVKKFVNHN